MRTKAAQRRGLIALLDEKIFSEIKKSKHFLVMLILPVAYYVIFKYIPMYGAIIAFKDFNPIKGILGSPWVGFKHFEFFFNSIYLWRLIRNTLLINLFQLFWGWPVPIIFALLLNEVKDGLYKRSIQTVSYLPHFISTVVIVSLMVNFLSPEEGIINRVIEAMGGKRYDFMISCRWFRTLYVSSGIWKSFGWGSIIYLAALSGINPELYQAAAIDGASRFQRIRHISIPGILPTIIILLILRLGDLMEVGFGKIILMYTPATYEVADVIKTYVYRQGIRNANFSYSAAIGIFDNTINFLLLLLINRISRKVTEVSLW